MGGSRKVRWQPARWSLLQIRSAFFLWLSKANVFLIADEETDTEWKGTSWESQNKVKNRFSEFNLCWITWLYSLSNVQDECFQCCCPSLMLFPCFCYVLMFLLLFAGKAKIYTGLAVVAARYRLFLCTWCGSYQLPPQWSCRNKGRMNLELLVCLVWVFLCFVGFFLLYIVAAKWD